jgi:hypothetical protein
VLLRKSKSRPCPCRQRRLACNYYCFFSFAGSSAGALELLLLDDEGALDPLAALPLGVELELDGVLAEPLELVAPPAAESFFVASADEELDDDGELGGVLALPDVEPDAEPEAEPEGELGVVLEPLDDVAPEPGVVFETARSPSVLSQPVSNPAPSARETATAKAVSLIVWASVGWGKTNGARFRPDAVPS